MTPSGLEPKSSEPESEILSIELWGLNWAAKVTNSNSVFATIFTTHKAQKANGVVEKIYALKVSLRKTIYVLKEL